MTAKFKLLNVDRPSTKDEWKRWCSARDMKFDDAREWLELYDYTLSIEEWEQELFDLALAINDHFDSIASGQGGIYEPQKREV